jgi:hypothetical protein
VVVLPPVILRAVPVVLAHVVWRVRHHGVDLAELEQDLLGLAVVQRHASGLVVGLHLSAGTSFILLSNFQTFVRTLRRLSHQSQRRLVPISANRQVQPFGKVAQRTIFTSSSQTSARLNRFSFE